MMETWAHVSDNALTVISGLSNVIVNVIVNGECRRVLIRHYNLEVV